MDDIALVTLRREMEDDCEAAQAALTMAADVFAESSLGRLAGCAHYVCRFFNVLEQMALRVAKAFENNIDDSRGWHSELIRRMTLQIPEVRPALFSNTAAPKLQHLRGFRHIVAHAYDLEFDPRQLELQLDYARTVADELQNNVRQFIEGVATMHGLTVRQENIPRESEIQDVLEALQCRLYEHNRGLKIPTDLNSEDIHNLMARISKSELHGNRFIMGDILAYVNERLPEYKSKARELAVHYTGKSDKSVSKWANTCKRIPFDKRSFNCEWTHYETVGAAACLLSAQRLDLLKEYESRPLEDLRARVKALNPKHS